ncbi:histidine-phosphotransfer domain, HPT domain-containing protein [Daedalea quercina L-15889]|uniref:Histidine-phosphotransfer domain, HPT domain-containing protein n=1 Tax=Daedalea quercina L-15889 TaxID=1314783 RepID=A0A165LCL6_9APHY|nr:histidine-phosphotransfer domain, HPT domain-containing protein [Daedalea quercina L-15889]
MPPGDTAPAAKARSPTPAAPAAAPSPAATPAPEPTPAPASKAATPAPPSRHPSVAPEREATPAVETAPSPAPAADQPDGADTVDAEAEGTIDLDTFHQILDLDEDDTHEFSKEMVTAYFTQANTTFGEMEQAYNAKDLTKLSSLGHFLKGSSAALGVARVQASCERIQHYGQLRDEEAGADLTDESALKKIEPLLGRVKKEYIVAETWLKKWYEDNSVPADDGE